MQNFEKTIEMLLAKTTTEVEQLLKSERLGKADPGEETPAESTPPGSSSEAPPPGPADDAPANDANPAEDASPSAAPDASSEEQPPTDPATEDQPMSQDELVGEYMKLPLEELKMHVAACQAAIMQMSGGADPAAAPGAPPAPGASPGAPPEAAPPMAPPAASPAPMGPPEAALKSEKANKEIQDLRKSVSELQQKLVEQQEGFSTSIEKLATSLQAPLRKSFTSISQFVGKPGSEPAAAQLTTEEVRAKLTALSRTPDLKKSDRSSINDYFTRRAGIESVAHLLK